MSKVTGSVTSEHLRRRSEEANALAKADEAAGRDLLALARQVVANEFLYLANAIDEDNATKAQAVPELAELRERLARAEGDRNAARNVVAEMHARWQRDGATPEQEGLFPQWLAAAGLTDALDAQSLHDSPGSDL